MSSRFPADHIPSSSREQSSASSLSGVEDDEGSEDSFVDEASVVAVSSEAGTAHSSNTESSVGLPANILKQLIQDIHNQGGIDSERFDLELITSKKPDIYGKSAANRGTKFQQQRHRSVQNKVSYWKSRRGRSNYSKCVQQYPPIATTTNKSKKSPKRQKATPPRQSKSSHQQSEPAAALQPVAQYQKFQPSEPTFSLDPIQPKSNQINSTMTKSFAETLLESVEYVPLTVIISPEGKESSQHLFGPFYINLTENKVVNDQTVHNGFHIELKDQDLRWMNSDDEEEVFAAWHVNKNLVLIRKPEPSFSFWKEPKEEEAARKAAKYEDERIIESYNVSRNAVTKDNKNMFKYYLLTFPEAKLGLNNSIFSPGAVDNQLDVDIHIVQSEFELTNSTGTSKVSSHRANVVWDIAIREKYPRYKQESGKKKNRLNAKLVASMDRLIQSGTFFYHPTNMNNHAMISLRNRSNGSKRQKVGAATTGSTALTASTANQSGGESTALTNVGANNLATGGANPTAATGSSLQRAAAVPHANDIDVPPQDEDVEGTEMIDFGSAMDEDNDLKRWGGALNNNRNKKKPGATDVLMQGKPEVWNDDYIDPDM